MPRAQTVAAIVLGITSLLLAGCSTPVMQQPAIPVGFTEGGDGVAYQFSGGSCNPIDGTRVCDDPADVGLVECFVHYTIYAYRDCPTAVSLEASVLDASGAVVGHESAELSGLTEGSTGEILLSTKQSTTSRFEVIRTRCG